MSPPRATDGRPSASGRPGAGGKPGRARRRALWLLLLPAVLFCLAPVVANRVEPRVLGVPFLLLWLLAATVVSPLAIWATARLDPAYRADADEPLPADDPEEPRETDASDAPDGPGERGGDGGEGGRSGGDGGEGGGR